MEASLSGGLGSRRRPVSGNWTGRYWARWGDAVREAGFEPNQLRGRYDDDTVLGLLVDELRRLGHMPTIAEMRLRRREDPAFPSQGVCAKWGPKRALVAKLAAFCKERAEYADVLEIVVPLLDLPDLVMKDASGESGEFGYVYLLKAGRHYKIGRSASFDRRERQLAIQLPERAQTVHVISTDDPVGIESYWHPSPATRVPVKLALTRV
jgi:hypothetical protein